MKQATPNPKNPQAGAGKKDNHRKWRNLFSARSQSRGKAVVVRHELSESVDGCVLNIAKGYGDLSEPTGIPSLLGKDE